MPYCSKCGVEVGNEHDNCPLCHFPIPDISVAHEPEREERFPDVKNIYTQLALDFKRKSFYALTFLLLGNAIGLMYTNFMIDGELSWSLYTGITFFALWVYLIFIFRYVRSIAKSIIGVGINTLVLLAVLDVINGSFEWFVPLGLPAVFMALIFLLINYYMWMKSKNKGLHTVAFSLFLVIGYCIGLEFFINEYLHEESVLVWSINVALNILPWSLLLLYIHYQIPLWIKEEIRKRFHI